MSDISLAALALMLEKLRGSHYTRRSPTLGLFVADNTPSEAADMLETLAARVAKLEAERDNLSDKLELGRALSDGAHRRAKAAEARIRDLEVGPTVQAAAKVLLDAIISYDGKGLVVFNEDTLTKMADAPIVDMLDHLRALAEGGKP